MVLSHDFVVSHVFSFLVFVVTLCLVLILEQVIVKCSNCRSHHASVSSLASLLFFVFLFLFLSLSLFLFLFCFLVSCSCSCCYIVSVFAMTRWGEHLHSLSRERANWKPDEEMVLSVKHHMIVPQWATIVKLLGRRCAFFASYFPSIFCPTKYLVLNSVAFFFLFVDSFFRVPVCAIQCAISQGEGGVKVLLW